MVVATDVYILAQIISKGNNMRQKLTFDEYERCFRPQLEMRMVFTGYAILSAFISLTFTIALMICDEYSAAFDRVITLVMNLLYISFGTVLATFCFFSL